MARTSPDFPPMKCPHCLVEFHSKTTEISLSIQEPKEHAFFVCCHELCPSCLKAIIFLGRYWGNRATEYVLVYPRGIARSPLPAEVPEEFAGDYREACLVLADSPKASAALSRRCLQHVLREAGKSTKKDLFDQIEEVIPKVPSHLGGMLHDVRVLGNFAAHPTKSTNNGEIIDVEPGEAEWLLDTLEAAFDFYFVQPEKIKQKRAALNAKLGEAGKQPLK